MWPVISKPTRITKSTATLIDNIIVSVEIYASYQSDIIVEDLSDHLPCLLVAHNMKLKKKEIPVITSRKITPKSIKEIQNQLSELNLANVVSKGDLDECFNIFHDLLTNNIDSVAPYESYVPRKQMYRKEPWLPVSLLKSIKRHKYLYTKSLRVCSNTENHLKYKHYRNTLTKLKQHCKLDYYHSKCVEFRTNTTALWNVINKITNRSNNKTSIIDHLEDGGISYNNPKDIANIFSTHFSTVGKNNANSIKNSVKNIREYLSAITKNTKSMFWQPATIPEISKIISNLPNKKSSGHDNIDNVLVKQLGPQLYHPLCILFNRSLNEGIFPTRMKLAEVVPLYKGKEHYLTTNYRLISLLITVSKILEKIVYKRTYAFLNDTGQLYVSQYGFRAKHFCEHAVQELVGNILKGMEQKN